MAAARETTLNDARDEYRRLLYVAMTRAAERLMVCGTRGKNKIPDGCWYQLVDDALRPASVGEKADDGGGEVLRFRKAGHRAGRTAEEHFAGGDQADVSPPLG